MANFWSTTDVEPKRNFRFQVQITGLSGGEDVLWWAKTVTTPSYDVAEVEHNHLDNKYYFPGRVSWNEISMTLVDPISIDAVKLTNDLVIKSGYLVPAGAPTTAATRSTISKKKAVAAMGGATGIIITVLSADGKPIEVWTLGNPFIKSAKYGDLDYSSDDLRTVELSLRYDWAVCDTGGNNGTTQFKPQ